MSGRYSKVWRILGISALAIVATIGFFLLVFTMFVHTYPSLDVTINNQTRSWLNIYYANKLDMYPAPVTERHFLGSLSSGGSYDDFSIDYEPCDRFFFLFEMKDKNGVILHEIRMTGSEIMSKVRNERLRITVYDDRIEFK